MSIFIKMAKTYGHRALPFITCLLTFHPCVKPLAPSCWQKYIYSVTFQIEFRLSGPGHTYSFPNTCNHLAVWRGRDEGIEVTLCTYGVSFYQSYGSGLRVRTKPGPYPPAMWRCRVVKIEVTLCTTQIFFISELRIRFGGKNEAGSISPCCVERYRDDGIGVLLCTYGFSFYQSYGSGLRVRTKPDLSTCCGERQA